MKQANIEELKGKTLKSVEVNEDNTEIVFTTTEDERYLMYHIQDCCESVYIEDIVGEWEDLIGHELLQVEESVNVGDRSAFDTETWTWTFYRLTSARGQVVLRWCGTSNGFYSESVDFRKYET